jgi:beta-glucosidase
MSERRLSRRHFLGASAGGVALAAAATPAARAAATPAAGAGGPFPKDFAWGVATAAYQVEGAAHVDGKGPSVWDVFCKKKGAIFEGDTGDVACDHYHRFKEDVALMKSLGVKSYRFSVSWPRVLPEGIGASNPKGLDFYSRLLDELGKAGIEPMCTVFHWDYPQALYQKGGWLNRDSADWFAAYTGLLADKFSDRVKLWATQNEPQCFIGMALLDGVHAPGDKLPFGQYLTAAHNGMRAHGKAVQVLRARAKDPKALKIGYVVGTQVTQPASEKPEDVEAARAAIFTVGYRGQWNNTWWMDPVLLGKYPDDGVALAGKDMPRLAASDLEEMKQPLDWLGLNIYKADTVRRGADGKPERVPVPSGYPRAGSDWQPITPACMYWGPRFMYDRYQLPIYLTENGLAVRDQVFLDGKVHDPQRIDVMHRYLSELARAGNDGVPVRGYYAWSLLDNFEWADGYKQRFGLVYVDFQNQRRVPKDSFDWYRKVIATNGRNLVDKTAVPITQVTPA